MTKGPAYVPDRRAIFATVSAFLLAGCSSNLIGPPEAPQLYVINGLAAAPKLSPGPTVAWALAIGMPSASDVLDSERIALKRSSTTMDYYADAQWPDRLPRLVQSALLGSFENSGRIPQVARSESALHADYSLESELRDFEARYDQPESAPIVIVKITSRMVLTRGRAIVSTFTAEQSVPAAANNLDAVVEAFDTALAAAMVQIVNWALMQPQTPSSK
jgi:cholesterol transport system auxiliary component